MARQPTDEDLGLAIASMTHAELLALWGRCHTRAELVAMVCRMGDLPIPLIIPSPERAREAMRRPPAADRPDGNREES